MYGFTEYKPNWLIIYLFLQIAVDIALNEVKKIKRISNDFIVIGYKIQHTLHKRRHKNSYANCMNLVILTYKSDFNSDLY